MSPRKVVSRSSYVDKSKVGQRAAAGTSRVHLGVVEAHWTCTSCGTGNIPGFTKVCPNCGNPRDTDETYQPPAQRDVKFLSADELRAAGLDEDHSGDQQCGYCGYFSKPGTPVCPYCSANLKGVARTCRKCPNCEHETNLVKCPQCGETTAPKEEEEEVPQQSTWNIEPPRFEGFDWSSLIPYWWVPVAIAVLGLIGFLLWPRQARVTVNDAWWTYTVSLQEYQYNAHEGWDLPYGADKTGEDTRIHHYDQVLDHYENQCHMETVQDGYDTETYSESVCESVYDHTEQTCYDDGSCDTDDVYRTECHDETRTRDVPRYKDVQVCEDVPIYRDEPRYATWYFYSIWEWVGIAPAVTTEHNFVPYWPTGFLIDDKHREAGRLEEYDVTLVTEDGEKSFSLTPASFDEYIQYQVGSEWLITYSGSTITEIEPAP